MVLTVSFELSPVIGLFVTVAGRWLYRLERQRRGVRTTRLRRPQACALVKAPHASIASRSASVTIAIRPCVEQDDKKYEVIWVASERKYF
jgi:hypothetical protein